MCPAVGGGRGDPGAGQEGQGPAPGFLRWGHSIASAVVPCFSQPLWDVFVLILLLTKWKVMILPLKCIYSSKSK